MPAVWAAGIIRRSAHTGGVAHKRSAQIDLRLMKKKLPMLECFDYVVLIS